jgi:hypothetical protein
MGAGEAGTGAAMRFRRSTRVLFLGFLVFAAISAYVLVVTHHLKLPHVSCGCWREASLHAGQTASGHERCAGLHHRHSLSQVQFGGSNAANAQRDKASVDALHHVLLEDFVK